MSRTRNANESLLEFRRIRESYRNHIHPLIKKIKEAYAGQVEKGLVDESLEAHVRVHVVNCLLAALNWRLDVQPGDGLPSLLPEAPIRSTATKTVRFFDYLGLETKSAEPLLVVETKRPSALLPRIPKSLSTYSEVVSQGLSGEELSGEWNKWLKDLQDYVRSTEEAVQKTPKRVVMTNGDWLIAFLDPSGAFLAEGEADPKMILVFESSSDIEARFNELFLQLEHQQVLGTAPPLTPGEMGFHLVPAMVDRVMHGLLVRYIEERRLYRTLPTITVAPVLLIRSVYGAWLRIETPPLEYELPREQRQLPQHLHDVDQAGTDLLSDASRRLGTSLQPLSLAKHYEDEDAFQPIRGVSECREESEYLLVTGDRCHYLLQASAVSDCPYHDWTACNYVHAAFGETPIVQRSTSPRSFFVSKESYHCAHRDVTTAKQANINGSNSARCGLRSGRDGEAFCEIWSFERFLCCRMCVFEVACTRAPAFQLPCLVDPLA